MEDEIQGETNPLALSDEDFLKQTPPGDAPQEEVVQEVSNTEVNADAEATPATPEVKNTEVEEVDDSTVDPKDGNVLVNKESDKNTVTGDATASTEKPTTAVEDKTGTQKPEAKDATSSTDKAAVSTTGTVDYQEFHKQIMAPFKANGKTIELKSADEAIQLMQMGANYTRKMQDIQPHRKTLLMLENNGLMDPDKLSYLIDLDKGNPEAIKKLLKDKGIDPMTIDTSEESNYLGGNHKVDDREVNFRNALDEVGTKEHGQITLQEVNSTWDQASKDALWEDPSILTAIHQQRGNGIYAAITTQVDHLRTLGQIPAGTSFLQAYRAVGDMLQAQGKLANLVPPSGSTAPGSTGREVLATRVATPKTVVANGDQVSAAAATRSTPRKVEKFVNPLAMSDEDFLKMNPRV